MNRKTDIGILTLSLLGFFIFSVSFLVMPFGGDLGSELSTAIIRISGLMFWIGLLFGSAMQVVLTVRRRRRNKFRRGLCGQPKIGCFSFFQNKIAGFFDIAMIVGLIGAILAVILTDGRGYLCYVFIALFVFSLSAHCIFNGKNYYYVTNKEKHTRISTKEKIKASR